MVCLFLRARKEGEGYVGINTRTLLRIIDPQSFPCLLYQGGSPTTFSRPRPLTYTYLIGWRVFRSSSRHCCKSLWDDSHAQLLLFFLHFIHTMLLTFLTATRDKDALSHLTPVWRPPYLPHKESDQPTGAETRHFQCSSALDSPQEICNTFFGP